MYQSRNWKTFHDFLKDYIFEVLGREWIEEQRNKPNPQRHKIVGWFEQAMHDARETAVEKNGIFAGQMTGAQRAFLNLSYNLYLIAHHSEPSQAETILHSYVRRLKSAVTGDFIGKLFETYASAAFLKAGFQIEYENESDSRKSHVEFTATYPPTGKKFSVEVKARNPTIGNDGQVDETKRLRVGQKLAKALQKTSPYARIVFIEVNVPDSVGEDYSGTWVEAALNQIKDAEAFTDSAGMPYPPAYVIVTNHAYHNNLKATDFGIQAIADGFRIPDFGPGATVNRFKEYLDNLERHKEILALFDSLKSHSHIPVTFDGEIPAFAFGDSDNSLRLKIGQPYIVPDSKGNGVQGVLENALVMESWKKAMATYKLENGTRIVVSHDLTENEWKAWREHPETFFGKLEEIHKEPKSWVEMAHFLYRSYCNTSKDKLLEFMMGHDNIEALRAMDQPELAITYCEMMGWSVWNDARK